MSVISVPVATFNAANSAHRRRRRRAQRHAARPRTLAQTSDQRRRQPHREHHRPLRHGHPARPRKRLVHIPTRLTLRQTELGLQPTHRIRRRTIHQQRHRAIHPNRVLVGVSPSQRHQPHEYNTSRQTPPRRTRPPPLKLEVTYCAGVSSSSANTTAATGGSMYKPTRSRIFSTSSGSGDTLKLSVRHGLSPKARQISDTV
jgi:hypothetical protein